MNKVDAQNMRLKELQLERLIEYLEERHDQFTIYRFRDGYKCLTGPVDFIGTIGVHIKERASIKEAIAQALSYFQDTKYCERKDFIMDGPDCPTCHMPLTVTKEISPCDISFSESGEIECFFVACGTCKQRTGPYPPYYNEREAIHFHCWDNLGGQIK